MYNNREYQYVHVPGAATTVAFVGRGNLGYVGINTATAVATITVYDNPTATITGTTVAVIASGSPGGMYVRDLVLSQGCTVVTTGASDITIAYAKG